MIHVAQRLAGISVESISAEIGVTGLLQSFMVKGSAGMMVNAADTEPTSGGMSRL
jgi:hypothetical protein